MKLASLFTAVSIILVANAFALIHAWRNRSGPVETEITLTERELPLAYRSNDDDSGVSFNLRWIDPAWETFGWERPAPWLDQKILNALGFDTSVAPASNKAPEFYQRQRARRAFVALEYDGPAWRKHVEQAERESREHAGLPQANLAPHRPDVESHLVAIDAATDAAILRGRHPDRNAVIIVPAVVRIVLEPLVSASQRPSRAAILSGSVQEVPSSIHVPRPFSDGFRRLAVARRGMKYRIQLRYGSSFEPWVAGVQFSAPAIP